jgi:hypothetical protein
VRPWLTVLLLSSACLASAAAAGQALTDDRVLRFAAARPEIGQLVAEARARGVWAMDSWRYRPQAGRPWRPFSGQLEQMKALPLYPALLEILSRHGFDDAAGWADVGDRIARAMTALDAEAELPQLRRDMEAERRRFEESEVLDPAQKKEVIENLEAYWAEFESMIETTPEDLEVVRRHRSILAEDGAG